MKLWYCRYALVAVLWGSAIMLVIFYLRVSLQLWREAISKKYRLTFNSRLPLITGLAASGAVVFGITGMVVFDTQSKGILWSGFVVAVIIGVLVGINISIRQKSAQKKC